MNPERVDFNDPNEPTLPDVRRKIAQACRRSRVAARLALGAAAVLAVGLIWADVKRNEAHQKRAEAEQRRLEVDRERNQAVASREKAHEGKEEALRVAQVNRDAVEFLSGQLIAAATKNKAPAATELTWLEPLLIKIDDREVEAAIRLKLGAALLRANRFDEAQRHLSRAFAINYAELGPTAYETRETRELLEALDAARKNAVALSASERETTGAR